MMLRSCQFIRPLRWVLIRNFDLKFYSSLNNDDTVLEIRRLCRTDNLSNDKKFKLKELLNTYISNKNRDNGGQDYSLINDSVEAIINKGDDLGTFFKNDNEILNILDSIKGLNSENIRTLQFLPVFLNRLALNQKGMVSSTKENGKLLEIYEHMVRFVLMSNKRFHFPKLIEEFYAKNPDPKLFNKFIMKSVESFKSVSPDSKNILILAQYYRFKEFAQSTEIIELFLEACEEELENGYKDNLVDNLHKMVELIDEFCNVNSFEKFYHLSSILKFVAENSIDKELSKFVMLTISKIPNLEKLFFLDKDYGDHSVNTVVTNCIKYNDPYGVIELLARKNIDSNSALPSSWEMLLQYEIYKKERGDELSEAIKEKLIKAYSLLENSDLEKIFNKLILICTYCDKSDLYISQLRSFFKEKIKIDEDCLSFAILINNELNKGDSNRAWKLFLESIGPKYYIDWSTDEDGMYLSVLFKAFTHYCHDTTDDIKTIFKNYKLLKSVGQRLDYNAISAFLAKLIESDYVGDGIELLERELSAPETLQGEEERRNAMRYDSTSLPEIYDQLYSLILTYNKNEETNWVVYNYLCKKFRISFDHFLPVMQKFMSLNRPNACLIIFQQMLKFNKEYGLKLPDETIYCFLFRNFGKQLYEDGVFKLHLYLKTDISINLNINILNSVLEGYCHLQDFLKTRDVFDQACSLPESRGVNNETITLMLKANTYTSLRNLQLFWNNLSEVTGGSYLILNEENYEQYLIGFCYHDEYDGALALAEEWRVNKDIEIGDKILKSLYNWTLLPEKREKVIEWCGKYFPKQYKRLLERKELNVNNFELPSMMDNNIKIVSTK
ncbi:hypothetical protein PACTADRAFT_140717 [Pachysolen tannophilus NRRL Y-2460]|uniref:Mitochondrial group I intron splicing factor CCM1 n=1 Tax=Pachysolen tannophilus NRRL Y-2460 TaxID=669874 RepID=A0A1E4U111_PACTA|nr:hypothetical protein PACTADRAFT_140717 [Pachysolen tannophilus NRRL Y-2460]